MTLARLLGGEFVALGSLFDYSDVPFRPKSLSAFVEIISNGEGAFGFDMLIGHNVVLSL